MKYQVYFHKDRVKMVPVADFGGSFSQYGVKFIVRDGVRYWVKREEDARVVPSLNTTRPFSLFVLPRRALPKVATFPTRKCCTKSPDWAGTNESMYVVCTEYTTGVGQLPRFFSIGSATIASHDRESCRAYPKLQ